MSCCIFRWVGFQCHCPTPIINKTEVHNHLPPKDPSLAKMELAVTKITDEIDRLENMLDNYGSAASEPEWIGEQIKFLHGELANLLKSEIKS